MRFLHVIALTALVFGGCSGRGTVSENQCAAGDWQTLGYSDGARGYRSSQLLAHQDACGKHGVVPDRNGYMVGWKEGIREYCEPNNGFSVGERGYQHNNACPAELREDFLHAYKEGRSLYLVRVEVVRLEKEISRKAHHLEQVKTEMVSAATAQLNSELTPSARVDLLARIGRLNDEKRKLQAEIPQLEAELAAAERQLDTLSQSLAAVTY